MKTIQRLFSSAIALTLWGGVAAPSFAQDAFDNNAIAFPSDTTVEFEFKESHGSYLASFGIRNETTGEETILFRETKPYDAFQTGQTQTTTRQDDTGSEGDFLGTVAGGSVVNGQGQASPLSEYTFRANNRYVFFLQSVSPTGQTRREVLSSQNFARFAGALDAGNQGDITGIRISLEDGGRVEVGSDDDFDDFVVEAGGFAPAVCPPIQ